MDSLLPYLRQYDLIKSCAVEGKLGASQINENLTYVQFALDIFDIFNNEKRYTYFKETVNNFFDVAEFLK